MLQSHLGGILDLRGRTTKQLTGGSGSHSASHANLTLATYLCPRYGGIRTHHISKQACRSQRTQYTGITELTRLLQVIKDRRHYTARTTSRSGHDLPTARVLLRHRQGIGIHHSPALDTAAIAFRTDHIIGSLTTNAQTSRQDAFRFQATTNRILHHFPYLSQIIPDRRAFVLLDIFPIGMASLLTPSLYLLDRMHIVYLLRPQLIERLVRQGSPADTIYGPRIQLLATLIIRLEQHPVRVERQESLGFPSNICLCDRL